MKKLGLVGGVGPASTLEYYKSINDAYFKRLENPPKSGANPPMVIDSLNLADAYDLASKKDWKNFAELFIDSIHRLHRAGAEFGAISANTAHIVFDDIQAASPIPLLGIVDEVCKYAKSRNYKKIIVFGTAFTMSSGMYEGKCRQYGLEAFVPNEADKEAIQNIIFPHLQGGIVLEDEKAVILEIADKLLTEHQADALLLGCTELPLIIQEGDLDAPLIDTTQIHIDSILREILA